MDLEVVAKKFITERYWKEFLYSFKGGKKIRPLLMKQVCKKINKDFSPLEKVALAIEIFHMSTLMHDDIIDEDDTRRNKDSFHKRFSTRNAILFGDYFATLSIKILKSYTSILNQFIDTMNTIVKGQLMELSKISSISDYVKYIERKTASLFILSAKIPLMYYNIKDQKVLDFAREYGLAFQIHNDLKTKEDSSILSIFNREQSVNYLKQKISNLRSMGIKEFDELVDVLAAKNVGKLF